MDNLLTKLKPYAPLFIRLGLAAVFLLFGYHKLYEPEQARAEIQLLLDLGIGSAAAINFYVGLFEIIVGISFTIGYGIKYTAPLAALSLLGILGAILRSGVTIDPNLYRDLGLIGAALSLWLTGAGPLSLDERRGAPADAPQAQT